MASQETFTANSLLLNPPLDSSTMLSRVAARGAWRRATVSASKLRLVFVFGRRRSALPRPIGNHLNHTG